MIFLKKICAHRSQLVQKIAIDNLAESMMAFNTNYKDTGLFGVYAIAKVCHFYNIQAFKYSC